MRETSYSPDPAKTDGPRFDSDFWDAAAASSEEALWLDDELWLDDDLWMGSAADSISIDCTGRLHVDLT